MAATFKRVLLTISYDGTGFSGWQRQLNGPSIQQEVEQALATVLREPTTLYGASRTDAGVHALAQAAHFNTSSTIPSEKFSFILNTLLPPNIRITKSQSISLNDHARYSACGKAYTYRIFNHPHGCGVFNQYYAHVPVLMDTALMEEAIPPLLGSHDFAAFSSKGGKARTTTRFIYNIEVFQEQQKISLVFYGNAFLYNMVRIMAGTLIEIGQKRLPKDVLIEALQTKNRLILGDTAPAKGLELTRVYYPWHTDIPFTPIAKHLPIHTSEGTILYR